MRNSVVPQSELSAAGRKSSNSIKSSPRYERLVWAKMQLSIRSSFEANAGTAQKSSQGYCSSPGSISVCSPMEHGQSACMLCNVARSKPNAREEDRCVKVIDTLCLLCLKRSRGNLDRSDIKCHGNDLREKKGKMVLESNMMRCRRRLREEDSAKSLYCTRDGLGYRVHGI